MVAPRLVLRRMGVRGVVCFVCGGVGFGGYFFGGVGDDADVFLFLCFRFLAGVTGSNSLRRLYKSLNLKFGQCPLEDNSPSASLLFKWKPTLLSGNSVDKLAWDTGSSWAHCVLLLNINVLLV